MPHHSEGLPPTPRSRTTISSSSAASTLNTRASDVPAGFISSLEISFCARPMRSPACPA